MKTAWMRGYLLSLHEFLIHDENKDLILIKDPKRVVAKVRILNDAKCVDGHRDNDIWFLCNSIEVLEFRTVKGTKIDAKFAYDAYGEQDRKIKIGINKRKTGPWYRLFRKRRDAIKYQF